MTKSALFTTYKRIVYSSCVKKPDFHTTQSRCISLDRSKRFQEKRSEDGLKEKTPIVERESSVGVKDTEGGEGYEQPKIITPKVAARPLNF